MLERIIHWFIFTWLARKLRKLSQSQVKESKRPHFEVERKYRISTDEFHRLPERLRALGFARKSKATITDTFLPAENDGDMLRVRDEVSGENTVTVITLKEWVDVAGGRERKERESDPIDSVTKETLLQLGRRLSTDELPSFSKQRTTYSGFRERLDVTVALDDVSGLGSYSGTYLEIEVIVERQEGVASARDFIESFVVELLGEKREGAISYMEMLKRSRQQSR